jgi:hypothetical protein
MSSKRSQEGYLEVDNRFAVRNAPNPYLPDSALARARAAGHEVTAARAPHYESATVTCAHCNAVVVLNPLRTRDREYCAPCDRYICDRCGLSRKLGAPHLSMLQRSEQLMNDAEHRIVLARG